MSWGQVLQALVSPTVFAALIVLIGVAVTAVVSLRVADSNRKSIENTAAERLAFENGENRKQRLLDDKRELYLSCMEVLVVLRDSRESAVDPAAFNEGTPLVAALIERRRLVASTLVVAEAGVRELFVEASNAQIHVLRMIRDGQDVSMKDQWLLERHDAHVLLGAFQSRAHRDLYGEPLGDVVRRPSAGKVQTKLLLSLRAEDSTITDSFQNFSE